MGIFAQFFSSESKENKKIRAQFKNEKYFKKEIERCNKWITNDKEDFEEYIKKQGSLTPFHYISSSSIRLDKLSNMYSLGEDIQFIQKDFFDIIEWFSEGWSEEYQGYSLLLQMVSLGILLDIPEKEFQKIKDFIYKADKSKIEEIWKPDSLIFYLLGDQDKKRDSTFPAYNKLYQITQQSKAEAETSLGKYLDNWYDMHKEEPWYNTHLKDWGYSGYWAWEVAAVVKVKGLDDSKFKDNPYYPYDMVHWKEK